MNKSFENIELPNIDEMTSEQKFWFASAIAGMVGADGHAEKEELDFLRQAIKFLDSKEDIDKIIALVKDLEHGVHPKLDKIALDHKQAFFILKYLAQIMLSDTNLSPKEVKFFLKVGRLVGYTTEDKNKNPLFR
ncbi:uncharacterized protein METZ01_LOCUS220713 [marine metagenome]|uniref:Co-chaperone DjlA N-terminal domain-containing protein n=1 Tax=marine metagenome TaxID=408172 RepID=A0A382FZ20_9ZZZZ|tara:strand:- start:135 stop:536 length:402 start_codon:yes stop_codon:yes gene_type:complete